MSSGLPPPPPSDGADPDWTGRVLGGRYRVEAVLAVGGLGRTYRAKDQKLGRAVILQVPRARYRAASEGRALYQDEIRKRMSVEHPHVVRVLDVGEDDAIPYAVLPLLAGGSLRSRRGEDGAMLTSAELAPWLAQIAEALDDLHARGDIHRCVRPESIRFDRPVGQGKANAYLADCGLANVLGADVTRTDSGLGTRAYLAPEQFNPRAKPTGAIDQYALATVIYESLAGELPFKASTPEELVFEKAVDSPRPLASRVPGLPPAANAAVLRALSVQPEDRFATCAEFARAFAGQGEADGSASKAAPRSAPAAPSASSSPTAGRVSAHPVQRTRAGPPDRARPTPAGAAAGATGRRLPPLWVGALALFGGLGGLGLLLGWFRGGDHPAASDSSVANAPRPGTEPARPLPPAPAATPQLQPAPPSSAPPPQAPPAPPAPAWKQHIEAAKAAARDEDWELAGTEFDLAVREGVPSGEIPRIVEDGVTLWRGPAKLTLSAPPEGARLAAAVTELRWTLTTPRETDIVTVTVNGEPVPAATPGRASAPLREGENEVVLRVLDARGSVRARLARKVSRWIPFVLTVPPWAKVSTFQLAEARRLEVQVAFENSIRMRFVLIPAGWVAPSEQPGPSAAGDDSTAPPARPSPPPPDEPFYVSIHETTNGQYRRCVADHDSWAVKNVALDGDDQPVVWVSQLEARTFAQWLRAREPGREYRLPTEVEWEYAARGGTRTAAPWGDDIAAVRLHANLGDARYLKKFQPSAKGELADDGFTATAPVGSLRPNPWGLYDVIGNASEWCGEHRDDFPPTSVDVGAEPHDPRIRSARGGSYASDPRGADVQTRIKLSTTWSEGETGFRLILPARADTARERVPVILPDEALDASGKTLPSVPPARLTPAPRLSEGATPEWARVSPAQVVEAQRLKVAVAFENALGMRFVLIPAGSFLMGAPKAAQEGGIEGTQHRVTLTSAYYMGVHETTNAQYRRFRRSHVSRGAGDDALDGDRQPVVGVRYNDAIAFAGWLTRSDTGLRYRLPTEAEWECAARAGTTTRFPWGDGEEGFARYANLEYVRMKAMLGDKGSGVSGEGFKSTAPVGSLLPNPFGLHDVVGNVAEWCDDWYVSDYPPGPATNPLGPPAGDGRVIRGGSWSHEGVFARVASRWFTAPVARDATLGFRLVAVIQAESEAPTRPESASGAKPDGPGPTPSAPSTGPAPSPRAPKPAPDDLDWALVSLEQIASAKRHGVPVAFENSIGMRFVLVPAGSLTMGSPPTEAGRDADETQHRVTFTRPFYVSIHETTNAQFRRFRNDHASQSFQGESLDGDTQPVVRVDHRSALEFAQWLNRYDSRGYRLPTEAEWEHAARSRTVTARYFDDYGESFQRHANVADARAQKRFQFQGTAVWEDPFLTTAPVGSLAPNPWGLFDMLGNASEWCADWYGDYPTRTVTDPPGIASGARRVIRGGAWSLDPRYARAAKRNSAAPTSVGQDLGFRLVVPAK